MKNSEFAQIICNESYLLLKDVRPSAYIYPVSTQNIKWLNSNLSDDIKYKIDTYMPDKIWLYRHKSVGLLIDSLSKLDYDAREVLMGLLLGYSVEQEDKWLQYVYEHKEDYIYD